MFYISFISFLSLFTGIVLFAIKSCYGKKYKHDERFNQIELYSNKAASLVLILGLVFLLIFFGFGGATNTLRTDIYTFKDLLTSIVVLLIGLYSITDFCAFHIFNHKF